MPTDSAPQQFPTQDHLIVVRTGEGSWLLQGEEHLDAMLTKEAPYPTPVFCLMLKTDMDFYALLDSEGVTAKDLWAVNTGVLDRLKRDGELCLITPQADA